MKFVTEGHLLLAIICIALSGLCDMFDGKVARRKLDRTDNEKLFGIQIDSLCDLVAFGVAPSVFCYVVGLQNTLGIFVSIFYCICGVIRLAYFNVLETNNFFSDEEHEKVYYGLPITSISIILPIFFVLRYFIDPHLFGVLLTIVLFITGILFVSNFKIKKLDNKYLAILVGIVAVALLVTIILVSKQ
ncbi:MAG: CDP-alcohol phosphatidyltransferase family protein [Clostridia bacterium]|nr:CDP-alcohol phosphatidyltransferase family protein [Clostridia bacterium]